MSETIIALIGTFGAFSLMGGLIIPVSMKDLNGKTALGQSLIILAWSLMFVGLSIIVTGKGLRLFWRRFCIKKG